MKKNKLISILTIVIAVLVVLESIVLVSNLDKKSANIGTDNEKMIEELSVDSREENLIPVADFIWETDSSEMEVGKTYNITLNLLSKKNLVLDSIETHVYFDTKLVKVSKLWTNEEIGEELIGKANSKTGLISSILFKNEGEVFESKDGEMVKVLSFEVTPIMEGKIDFEVSTGVTDKKFTTIILEVNKNESSPYLSSKLEINVVKQL